MKFVRLALASLVPVLLSTVASADDTGNFVIRLGQDTTSVERYVRTASRLEVHQVGRAPRVLRRHFIYDYAGGKLSRWSMVVTPPGSDTPTQTIEAGFEADSFRVHIQPASGPAQNVSVSLPQGTLVTAISSPWAAYEGEMMKLVKGKADSLRGNVYFIGGPAADWLHLTRRGRDTVAIDNGHLDRFNVAIDKSGRILGARPISGTGMVGVTRVPSLDLDAMAASFAAREKAGAGIGPLSPRDSVRATVGGASLWVDYGRPGKRGRAIFGTVVPYGEVWRTGANAATQFRSDKALVFGGTVIPAGTYTLWTVPSASGWTLIFNSQTGQWGTEHDASKDVAKVAMSTSTLPQPVERFTIGLEPGDAGGTLTLDWDTTRASAAFTVQP